MSKKSILLASAMFCVVMGQFITSCWFEYQQQKEREQQRITQMATEEEIAKD